MADNRDAITEAIMAQEESRWDKLPPASDIEDRRAFDPLDAYVRPKDKYPFEINHPVAGWADVMEHVPNDGTMRYPGPMPLDMGADIDRFAVRAMATPPQPEQFGGPMPAFFDPFQHELETMYLMEGVDRRASPAEEVDRRFSPAADVPGARGRIHLDYGMLFDERQPPNPYVRKRPGER